MIHSFKQTVKKISNVFVNETITMKPNLDELLPIEDIIFNKGYPLEIHTVTTEDGYILRVYRIPGKKLEENYLDKVKPPVYFQHGLLDSSDGWVCNDEDKCLPFIMANKDYDVWLGNTRGNKHSKAHIEYSPLSFEFWSFSFHEMGKYDIPATLDYIREKNKSEEKIIYIGHSQGTCMLFSALSLNCAFFQERIKMFIAMGPVARITHMKSSIIKFFEKMSLNSFLKTFGDYELFPNNDSTNKFNLWVSKNIPSLASFLLENISDGNTQENNNNSRMKVYMTHYPAGTSFKSMNHFLQCYKAKKYVHYNYGKEANMTIYRQINPPEYNLSNITGIPIMLLVGKEDKLATVEDVEWLYEQIKDSVIYYKVLNNMGHISFMMGNNITWFYELLEQIENFDTKERLLHKIESSDKLLL